ncbi:MAG: MaoC family dehydratase N-terminal domain-containing protein [Blastomonas fulva]|uniref:MaoC/PaaZ C-terminal domain-containing protein n=1 Tax=Blastomonas fulva TaxID=1550728 RepID=UPI0024E1E242|nr:MaoC/PaaZ C-terminal domain-containing protein [Blastomonas fulva]MDK2757166.1 MaoC family dehydratase N-terminal domain-containing protein [Blastomonas fulva]
MTRPLDLDRLLAYKVPDARDDYDPRDAIIYALGVGAGLRPDIDETRFLFERHLEVLPTMALVLGTPGFWPMDPQSGLDWPNILHGEQHLRLFQPLDPAGMVHGETRITDVADKGLGKAALIRATKTLRTLGGTLIAEATETWVARGAGGFGGERDLPGEALPPVPDRTPDLAITLPTSVVQAATYRLSGDRNPLHIDSQSARQAGYDRPILHGLSTMGVIARALIHACAGGEARALSEIALRFTAPVYPGDTLATHIWQQGDRVRFRTSANERGVVVADNGNALLVG